MLLSILSEFRSQAGPLSASELATRLGVTESALEGMLSTLARQGRLTLVGDAAVACELCPLTTLCAGGAGQRAYVLAERGQALCECAATN